MFENLVVPKTSPLGIVAGVITNVSTLYVIKEMGAWAHTFGRAPLLLTIADIEEFRNELAAAPAEMIDRIGDPMGLLMAKMQSPDASQVVGEALLKAVDKAVVAIDRASFEQFMAGGLLFAGRIMALLHHAHIHATIDELECRDNLHSSLIDIAHAMDGVPRGIDRERGLALLSWLGGMAHYAVNIDDEVEQACQARKALEEAEVEKRGAELIPDSIVMQMLRAAGDQPHA